MVSGIPWGSGTYAPWKEGRSLPFTSPAHLLIWIRGTYTSSDMLEIILDPPQSLWTATANLFSEFLWRSTFLRKQLESQTGRLVMLQGMSIFTHELLPVLRLLEANSARRGLLFKSKAQELWYDLWPWVSSDLDRSGKYNMEKLYHIQESAADAAKSFCISIRIYKCSWQEMKLDTLWGTPETGENVSHNVTLFSASFKPHSPAVDC